MKNLPKVYKCENVKSTNKKMYCSFERQKTDLEDRKEKLENTIQSFEKKEILEILHSLFQNRTHTYTKMVEIKTKNKTYRTRLVFISDNKVITIDNEAIYLDDIVSIQI